MTEHARDWDAQRERLSAYLDGRVTEAERQALADHIAGCARCATELTELQQVVALLRAMPTPTPPRSFALPVPDQTAAPSGSRVAADVGRMTTRPRARWSAVAQWAGGVAAAAGIVLLLGSALAGSGIHPSMYGAASAPAAVTAKQPNVSQGTPATPSGTYDGATGAGTPPAASPSASPQQIPAGATPGPGESSGTGVVDHTRAQPGDARGAGGFHLPQASLPLTGAVLVVAGAATFAAGSGARRRTRRR